MIKAPKWSSILQVLDTIGNKRLPSTISYGSKVEMPALRGIRFELRESGKPIGGANALAKMMNVSYLSRTSWPHWFEETAYTYSREYSQIAGSKETRKSATSIFGFTKRFFLGDPLAKRFSGSEDLGIQPAIGKLYNQFIDMQAQGKIPTRYEFGITAIGGVTEKASSGVEKIFKIFGYQTRKFSKGRYPDTSQIRDVNYLASEIERISRPSSNVSGNTIEGMAHGGAAEFMRKALTDFSSPWRGIVSVPHWMMNVISKKATGKLGLGAANILNPHSALKSAFADILPKLTPKLKEEYFSTLEKMAQVEESGWGSVVAISSKLKGRKRRGIILHERTHFALTEANKSVRIPLKSVEEIQQYHAFKEKAISFGYKPSAVPEELLAYARQWKYLAQYEPELATYTQMKSLMQNVIAANPISKMPMHTEIGSALRRQLRAMQSSTDMVKANTTGMTTPGLAQHPRRGGSRQTPHGST